jgi:hypothetical protein
LLNFVRMKPGPQARWGSDERVSGNNSGVPVQLIEVEGQAHGAFLDAKRARIARVRKWHVMNPVPWFAR